MLRLVVGVGGWLALFVGDCLGATDILLLACKMTGAEWDLACAAGALAAAAAAQESVPSKWSGAISDCARDCGERSSVPPKQSRTIDNLLIMKGFMGHSLSFALAGLRAGPPC